MKRTTTNKLNMYQSVHAVLSQYQTVWQGIPAFAGAVSNFESQFELLQTSLVEQSSATTGVSTDKNLRIEELRERILLVQRTLFLLGREQGDTLLQERNRKTKSSLTTMSFGKLAVRCKEVKVDIDAHGSELINYGITPDFIEELNSQLLGIDELNNSVRLAILKRKNATESINDLELAIDKLLRVEMDGLILLFKNTPFFKAFRHARAVVDYGSHGGNGSKERDDGTIE